MGVSIQKATQDDLMDIFDWRNDPVTCQMSLNSNPIKLDAHREWFKKAISSKNIKMYMAFQSDAKVGVCRFDMDSNIAEISINLNPSFRNKGLSFEVLKCSIDAFFEEVEVNLIAKIKEENVRSVDLFKRCGFVFDRQEVGFNVFSYSAGDKK